MDTIPANVFGALVIALPVLFIALLAFWRRQKPVFFLVLASLIVGLGYLMTTGATTDIAKSVRPSVYAPIVEPTEIGDGIDAPATPAQ
ncbi:MAG: hypothetical protein ACRBCJ_02910 [Hyphomicrobiaceae bacterium]